MSNPAVNGQNSKTPVESGLNTSRTPSTESTASVISGTTGRFTADINTITTYGQNLHDLVCALIWCPKHKKVALSRFDDKKGFFFPAAPVRTGQTWHDCIRPRIKEALKVGNNNSRSRAFLSFSEVKLIHILRLQIPVYLEFVQRILYMTELTYDPKYATNCCSDTKAVNWFPAEDLIHRRVEQLWGPEPEVFVEHLVNSRIEDLGTYTEFGLKDILLYSMKERPKVFQDELVKSAGFTDNDIYKVFGDFFQHSFPSQYMNNYSFEDYIRQLGIHEMMSGTQLNAKKLYRSFLYSGRPFLSFHEFFLGLCALEKNTSHGGTTGELRCGYIFRYYNESNDKKGLTFDDIKQLTKDIIKSQSEGQLDESKVEAEARLISNCITGVSAEAQIKSQRIDEKTFMKSIGERRLRGTSVLFRLVVSTLQQIRMKRVYESIQLYRNKSMTAIETKIQKIKGTCLRCRQKKYSLAVHTVLLSKNGLITDPQENKGQSDTHKKSRALRKMSEKSFSSSANFLMDVIRNYAYSGAISGLNSVERPSLSKSTADVWANKSNRLQQFNKILSLCTQCEAIFKKEPRMVRVSSPVFVLGDIHGNLHDLMIYERWLWRMGPTCVASNFLFLGDYVDRGDNGVECIIYLLSNKALSPERYWLLRGNHELRRVQEQFTFRKECLDKFGNNLGLQVWEAFNKVFDVMPICAIIDDSIFCSHGGIPTSTLKVEEILRVPTPLEDPENQSQIAWQILWNDPVTTQEFKDYQDMLKEQNPDSQNTGFLPNTKRGTAHFFSEQALSRFLTANQLSHVIRAHEVIPNGYAFHMGGRCITIFSSSKYCGGLNEAAVVLVNDEKIRVIKIDTN